MRLILALATLCAACPVGALDAARFNPVADLKVIGGNSYLRGDVFINTHTGETRPSGCREDRWCTVDLGDPSITAVFLSGILIITHGSTAETADLQVGFRAYGDVEECPVPQTSSCVWYVGQVTEAHIGGGQRAPFSTWVPVKGGRFEYKWHRSTKGRYPDHPSYGINLGIQAVAR